MRWDRFFEDLEDQLSSEWEAERAALDTEAERLRLSRVTLRERLVALAGDGEHTLDVGEDAVLRGRIAVVGADWLALQAEASSSGGLIVPLAAIRLVGASHADLLRSARPPASAHAGMLSDRMTLGFVLRDAARRRVPVEVRLLGGRTLSGTIDRAGADHLDLALHPAGTPRRASEVSGHRVVPFGA
ncbi:MAG TPA: hypothetical protein VFN24_03325, partial [Microbacterium sp.]|nr:hypothetical protein [Microbacterium sp.]